MKLYEIPLEAMDIEEQLAENYGELTPELAGRIEQFMEAGKDKLEAAAIVVMSLETDGEVCKGEAKRLLERAAGLTAGADRLRALILGVVDRAFAGKIKTQKFTVWGQNAGKTTAIDLAPGVELTELPPQFVRVVRELSRSAVKAAVVNGEAIPDGIIVTELPGTRFLRIK